MKRLVLATVLLSFVGASSAQAATITYDAVLSPPCSACAAPGFYNGSGNPAGGFTLTEDNGIEVALRAKYRNNPAVITPTFNVYDVVIGPQTLITSGGNGANGGLFAWNWDFDINLRPDGVGFLTLADIDQNTFMFIENLTSGGSVLFNPFVQFGDNATWGAAGERIPNNTATGIAGGDWGAENSQNCAFAGSCPVSFTMASNDLLRLTLTVVRDGLVPAVGGGNVLATSQIYVRAGSAPSPIPEPATLSLLGLGLVGVAVKLRRRRRT